jgi:HAD superfamily hydrolase (TIGR01509 family)
VSEARSRVVLFDLGGVLLPFDQDRRVAALVRELGCAESAARALVASGLGRRLDQGAEEAELTGALSDLAGRAVAAVTARQLWLSVFEAPNAPLWATAAALRRRVVTGALSDNPGFVREVFPRDDAFDHVFLSCELGHCKPTPEVFATVAERLGARATDILFVDDVEDNVAAARGAGWDALLYRSNEELAGALAERGLA